jgi:hypothetical protein
MEWPNKETDILKKLLEDGKTLAECAEIMGRSYNSIEHKARVLKFTRPKEDTKETKPLDFSDGKLKPAQKQELLETFSPLITDTLKDNIFTKRPYIQLKHGLYEEEAVLVLSDMHTGMINEIYDPNSQSKVITYNEEIRQKELTYLRDSMFEIQTILSKSYNLRKLHILILGDMITNDRIFDGQKFEIDRPYGKQVWDTVRDLTYFVNQMTTRFPKVHVIGIVGNHGRSNEKYSEEPVENNFEWTLYKIMQESLKKNPNVEMEVPDTRFYSTQIFGHRYYMHHGDNLRGFSKTAVERGARDLLTTLIPDLPSGFDVYLMGHLHSAEKMDLNERSTMIVNGSFIPRDQYGYKMFRRYSKPQQWFFGVGKSRPITWSYALDLKGTERTK